MDGDNELPRTFASFSLFSSATIIETFAVGCDHLVAIWAQNEPRAKYESGSVRLEFHEGLNQPSSEWISNL